MSAERKAVLFWLAVVVARRWLPAIACALTIVEIFVFTFDYNAITDRRYYASRLPILDALRRAAPAEIGRAHV